MRHAIITISLRSYTRPDGKTQYTSHRIIEVPASELTAEANAAVLQQELQHEGNPYQPSLGPILLTCNQIHKLLKQAMSLKPDEEE